MSYVQTCNYRLVNLRVTVVFVVVVGSGGGVGVGVAVAVAAVVVLTLTHRQIESVVTNRTDPNIQEWKSISEKKKQQNVYTLVAVRSLCASGRSRQGGTPPGVAQVGGRKTGGRAVLRRGGLSAMYWAPAPVPLPRMSYGVSRKYASNPSDACLDVCSAKNDSM